MFEPAPHPRLFALPPGVDFVQELLNGLDARLGATTPEAWARVTIFVNTRRMQRRIREAFDAGPARALPRVRLVTDLALDPRASDLPPPAAPLRRRLEVAQLVHGLLQAEPDFAPQSAVFDLAESLVALMDEMHGEGVTPADIDALDVTDESGHWARSLSFFRIVQPFFGESAEAPGGEQRQRAVIEALARGWVDAPPADPVIVAGSTGSRGATALLMESVARLPQGAVILPGFDFDMPQRVWDRLDDALTGEDHPQFRFRSLMERLGMGKEQVARWTNAEPASAPRNALLSLSLRPAPVTDEWLSEGPGLTGLGAATEGLTLLEAPSPRIEAEAIALRLRHAVEEGITAALITPDRMLTRQVASALDRWDIVPDDSAGMPLALSPPGRFLRQVADLCGQRIGPAHLLGLLKHPLCHSGRVDRGAHLLRARELELSLRRNGPAFPVAGDLVRWAEKTGNSDPGRLSWAHWLGGCLDGLVRIGVAPLGEVHAQVMQLASALAAGPGAEGSGDLWEESAGRTARAACDQISRHADAGGTVAARDYAALLSNVLSGGEVRNRDAGHPQVLIWGTLEARVQMVDLTILAGMNEGTWPGAPAPDPWLNRRMRKAAGLLLPERRIGLAAHDYVQAIAGREVWITRSLRNEEADTVPSRWINRLTNLLGGLRQAGGDVLLAQMHNRAAPWIASAVAMSEVGEAAPARRPSPRPPVAARPTEFSVTDIGTLIRDPYAIYAKRILRLGPLDPLTPEPDTRFKGTVIHRIFETFLRDGPEPSDPDARDRLLAAAAQVLEQDCPWPTMRLLWLAQIERVADWFLATEADRQARGKPGLFELAGRAASTAPPFTLKAKADRVDIAPDGSALIYDYKTGNPPTPDQQAAFDKQLLLEAAMIERGGFEDVTTRQVKDAEFIGLGTNPRIVKAPLETETPEKVWSELCELMSRWRNPERGYTARMAPQRIAFDGDYDHLARRGEWSDTDDPMPEDLE